MSYREIFWNLKCYREVEVSLKPFRRATLQTLLTLHILQLEGSVIFSQQYTQ
jgi:hypothetical protein